MIHLYQDTPIGGGDALYAMSDVNINNPEDGQMLVYDASTQRWRNVTQKSLNDLAEVTDLTNIIATGTTNATGSTIPKGTFFYLNDDLCQAKADIASGATFTLNTNYEEVTAGGLNALNSNFTVTSDTIATNLTLFKMWKIRNIQFNGCTSGAGGAVATLSNIDAPTDQISIPVLVYITNKFFDGYLQITSQGAIVAKYYLENSTSEWAVPSGGRIYGSATWFTA